VSEQDYRPGQFPIAAVDGATSTKWQPKWQNETTCFILYLDDLYLGAPVSSIDINWGNMPPQTYEVYFTNSTFDEENAIGVNQTVAITHPFNETEMLEVKEIQGNITSLDFAEPVYASSYVRLCIEGNQGHIAPNKFDIPKEEDEDQYQGATVAEFIIIAEGAGRDIPFGWQVPLFEEEA